MSDGIAVKREGKWRLKRTAQCDKCPWKLSTDPHDIPNGYTPEKHSKLCGTIAQAGAIEQTCDYLNGKPLRVMACHEEHTAHCIGWLKNQMGPGNNLRLRIAMLDCENLGEVTLDGKQHENFEDTLPKD
jgi:hypothetical protein